MAAFSLSPTKFKPFSKEIYGFDIETYNKNKNFLFASIYKDDNNYWFFKDKESIIKFFKKFRFRNTIISATNLGFDFHGTFYNQPESKDFKLSYRGSDLLSASTYMKKSGEFSYRYQKDKLTFIDTMNYAKLSVEKLGKLINIPKLEKPSFIGRRPKNKSEWEYFKKYNLYDSKISKYALEFMIRSFNSFGANYKPTIASTSMSLFRNKYLKDNYYKHDTNILLEQFKGYYGGRTEAFSRGLIKNYNYYDFNSLYPSVMLNEFPDPNTLRTTFQNTIRYIEGYEGISFIDIAAPKSSYPLLPYRFNNKLLFPSGSFSGWYSHLEIRKALSLGYVVKKVRKTYYYTDTCYPFRDFVLDMYEKRQEFKKAGNPMEYTAKILMNSLYGKFAQKFTDRDNWIHADSVDLEEINKHDTVERVGDYFRFTKKLSRPPIFSFPIWSIYVTAYARLKLYDYIIRSNPVYVDTDSLITKKEFIDSDKLGKLKLEMRIRKGVIVKPKFYALEPYNKAAFVKAKGLGCRLSINAFIDLLLNPKCTYNKFMKFKESIRRGFIPNEIQEITKELNIEDDKRIWERPFDMHELQESRSIDIESNKLIEHKIPCYPHPS